MKKLSLLCFSVLLFSVSSVANAGWFSGWFHDSYTETQYPIVLVHGFSGFDNIAGVDYFYQIPQELERSGADVYVLSMSAANTSVIRGEQAARQIETILAATGADKVNLIGHSQGGPTARYVAAVYPQYVASVSMVGAVNYGTPLADLVVGISDKSGLAASTIKTIGNAFFSFIDWISGGGHPQAVLASAQDMTTASAAAFNAQYPAGMPSEYCGQGPMIGSNGIYYFSWSGSSQVTTGLDPTDPFLALTSLVFQGEPNDGITSACSSHWGKVLRDDYNMNHLDEVNQVVGMTAAFSTNPVSVFRAQANRLKNLGL